MSASARGAVGPASQPIDARCVWRTDRGHLRCVLVARGREGMQLHHMKQSPRYHGEAIGCTLCGVRNPRSRREPVRSSSDECVARPALRGLRLLAFSPHIDSYRAQAVHECIFGEHPHSRACKQTSHTRRWDDPRPKRWRRPAISVTPTASGRRNAARFWNSGHDRRKAHRSADPPTQVRKLLAQRNIPKRGNSGRREARPGEPAASRQRSSSMDVPAFRACMRACDNGAAGAGMHPDLIVRIWQERNAGPRGTLLRSQPPLRARARDRWSMRRPGCRCSDAAVHQAPADEQHTIGQTGSPGRHPAPPSSDSATARGSAVAEATKPRQTLCSISQLGRTGSIGAGPSTSLPARRGCSHSQRRDAAPHPCC